MSAAPDDARRFIATLAGSPAAPVTFQTFDDGKPKRQGLNRVLHGRLDDVWPELRRLNEAGAGVYVMLNEGDLKGRSEENVRAVRALFVDLDKAPLEPVLDKTLPRPHLVTRTSEGKYHAIWRVSDCPLDLFTKHQKALARRFGGDISVSDLPRVCRVPGFWHKKGVPQLSTLVSAEDFPPYHLFDLVFGMALEIEQPAPPRANGHAAPAGDARSRAYCRATLDRARAGLGGSGEGDRSRTLFADAAALGRLAHFGHYSEGEAREALRWASEHNGQIGTYGESEFLRTFANGWQAGTTEPKDLPERDAAAHGPAAATPDGPAGPEPPDWAYDEAPARADAEPAPRKRKANGHAGDGFIPTFFTAEDLDQKVFPPLEWIIQDILPVGLAILAGKSKIGKSWLALDIALSVAGGVPLFGQISTFRHQVLYLALEDGDRRLNGRKQIILGSDPSPTGLTFTTEWVTADRGGIDLIAAYLDAEPACRLVIIDTLGKIRGTPDGRKNAYQQDYEDMAALKQLADSRGICLLLVHHTRKMAADDVFDLVSGTTGIIGAADTIMVLTKKRGEDVGQLAVTGRDIIEDGEFAVRFDKPTGRWKWLGRANEVKAETDGQKIVQLLMANGGLMTPAEIAEELGIVRNTVKVTLSRLKKEMRVENPTHGRWRAFGSGTRTQS